MDASVYGLIKVDKGAIVTVASRNSSNDGVETKEKITLKNVLGQKTMPYNIWDKDYIVLNS